MKEKFVLYSSEMQMFIKVYGKNIRTCYTGDVKEAMMLDEKPTIPESKDWSVLKIEIEINTNHLVYGTNKISEFGYFVVHIVLNRERNHKALCKINCRDLHKSLKSIGCNVDEKGVINIYRDIRYKRCSMCNNFIKKNNINFIDKND